MKQVALITLAITFFAPSAFAKVVPLTCIQSKFGKLQEHYCAQIPTDFSSRRKTIPNVCVFKSGKWRLGNVTITNKDQITAPYSYKFLPKEECNKGITAIDDNNLNDAKGPTEWDSADGAGDVTYDAKTRIYTSKAPNGYSNEPIQDVSSCVVSVIGRRARGERACNPDPNGIGYCRFLQDLKTRHHHGHWWVRYAGRNQKLPRVCRGGVRQFDVQEMANTYQREMEKLSPQRIDAVAFVSDAAHKDDIKDGVAKEVSACFAVHPITKTIKRYACNENIMERATGTDLRRRGDCVFHDDLGFGAPKARIMLLPGLVGFAMKADCVDIEYINKTVFTPVVPADEE